jgi:hypothetical protein
VELLGCRYPLLPTQGGNSGYVLAWSNLLRAARIRAALNAAKVFRESRGCPVSPAMFALIFRYADGSRLLVVANSIGCGVVTNGARVVVAPLSLIKQLNADLGGG